MKSANLAFSIQKLNIDIKLFVSIFGIFDAKTSFRYKKLNIDTKTDTMTKNDAKNDIKLLTADGASDPTDARNSLSSFEIFKSTSEKKHEALNNIT